MKLETAQKLATLNERQLDAAYRAAGYESNNNRHIVEKIISHDIRAYEVQYKCVFVDDGSFSEDDDRTSWLYVSEKNGTIIAEV